jgi:hypothetical protein
LWLPRDPGVQSAKGQNIYALYLVQWGLQTSYFKAQGLNPWKYSYPDGG